MSDTVRKYHKNGDMAEMYPLQPWRTEPRSALDNCKGARKEQMRNMRHRNKIALAKGQDVEVHNLCWRDA
jgi:hypothetical protein